MKHLLLLYLIFQSKVYTKSTPFARLHFFFFFSSRRRHTILVSDWSSDVCSSDLHRVSVGGLAEDRSACRRSDSLVRPLCSMRRASGTWSMQRPRRAAVRPGRSTTLEIGRAHV